MESEENRDIQGARYLAIDGGGTKTTFLLADARGNEICSFKLGPSNPNDVGMEETKRLLTEGIVRICGGSCGRIILYAGIAGARTGNNKEELLRFLGTFGFEKAGCGSDVDSLIAMGEHARQIFMILGTGIIAFAKKDDEIYRVAGWGQLFDGAGSGYDLGRDAICAALYASDGTGAQTVLTELFKQKLGMSAADHLGQFYSGGKPYIAGFAPLLFAAEAAGDPVAVDILRCNIEHMAAIIRAAAAKLCASPVEVLLTGGLIDAQSDTIMPLLAKELGNGFHLQRCEQPPVYGALRLAQKEDELC